MQEVNSTNNEGALVMGIHYDYKSTRGDIMKKKLKEKLVLNKEEQKNQALIQKSQKEMRLCMTLINLSLLRI